MAIEVFDVYKGFQPPYTQQLPYLPKCLLQETWEGEVKSIWSESERDWAWHIRLEVRQPSMQWEAYIWITIMSSHPSGRCNKINAFNNLNRKTALINILVAPALRLP